MSLCAISPIDGRYSDKTSALSQFFSEKALIRYRLVVEVEYFIALCKIPLKQLIKISEQDIINVRNIIINFSLNDAERIKEIEKVTNHDVKAVEYFLREKFDTLGLSDYKEFIHFGLTSQDINNTAMPMMLKESLEVVILPEIKIFISELTLKVEEWKSSPMLARTHGQPASPTTMSKELMVFVERLNDALFVLENLSHTGKFGGATGNFNAHIVALPNVNWEDFANNFLQSSLGLKRQKTTTQIEHYDGMAAIFNALSTINIILTDFSRDIWLYVMMEYFKQKVKKGEVGSSAMPHKVNPIDFENAEGNLGMANAIFSFFSSKLPISRLQRDLTDSTVTRNIGVPLAHTMIALKSLEKGLGKLLINKEKMHNDLELNWAVLAEPIQTILRRENYPDPYNALKDFTRGKDKIDEAALHVFVDNLNVSDSVKNELKSLRPESYIGNAY